MKIYVTALIISLDILSCGKEPEPGEVIVFAANGDISDEVASFRALLGDPLKYARSIRRSQGIELGDHPGFTS